MEKEVHEKRLKGCDISVMQSGKLAITARKEELNIMLIKEDEWDFELDDSKNPPSVIKEITIEISLNSVIRLSNLGK